MDNDETDMREIALAEHDIAPIKTGFSWNAFAGALAAIVWLAAAIGAPISYYGLEAIAQMNPAMQAAMLAIAFGPAILFWLSASAVGEAAKARKLALALTDFAQEAARRPAPAPVENTIDIAHRLTIRTEIEALNDAVGAALNRLVELEGAAQRNATLFSQALAETRESADSMVEDFRREREGFAALNAELREDSETFARSVGRQVRLMREASKLTKAEVTAAEEVFETHLAAFSNAANSMAVRTADFQDAAAEAHAAARTLDDTMGGVLDSLSEATKLTDAARRSAEDATAAATATANAVRDTTQRAIVEAKRAAQSIRAETEAMQEAAEATFLRLKDAADAARSASEDAQAAAARHAASIEKRLAALAATAAHRRETAAPVERKIERPVERKAEREIERVANDPFETSDTLAQQAAIITQRTERKPRFGALKGFASWSNFSPAVEASNDDVDAFALADFGDAVADPDAALKRDAVEIVTRAGVELGDTFDAVALETIAQRSRQGAAARRRAVADAAPVAVSRISRYLKRNVAARRSAEAFRARPDLAKAERKGSDLVRAYLLVDAAIN